MQEFFSQYWLEFITIASVHILAVASPGPDFAVVLKHSISYGRRAAMYTSVGIGLAILVHVAYSLLGIGLVIKNTPGLFSLLSYAAAAYLFYIGWGAIRSQAHKKEKELFQQDQRLKISNKKAFWLGFLTNGINPKATLFFLSVFVVAVSPDTPNHVKLVYGIYLSIATGIWFCGLSYLLSSKKVRGFLTAKGFWFDRIMGAILILLAIKLVITA